MCVCVCVCVCVCSCMCVNMAGLGVYDHIASKYSYLHTVRGVLGVPPGDL